MKIILNSEKYKYGKVILIFLKSYNPGLKQSILIEKYLNYLENINYNCVKVVLNLIL